MATSQAAKPPCRHRPDAGSGKLGYRRLSPRSKSVQTCRDETTSRHRHPRWMAASRDGLAPAGSKRPKMMGWGCFTVPTEIEVVRPVPVRSVKATSWIRSFEDPDGPAVPREAEQA